MLISLCIIIGTECFHIQDCFAKSIPVKISKSVCRQILAQHTPRQDVVYSARSSDQKGFPVNINSFQLSLPETITIPLELKRSGAKGKYWNLGEQKIGTVTLRDNGNVMLNGHPLTNKDQRALRLACKTKIQPPSQ